jgi:hypothetical protein
MADTLDQDVRALKEWLTQAWRYLAESSLTRFERQELRNHIKKADAALRTGLEKLAARDRISRERYATAQSVRLLPDFRILKGAILQPEEDQPPVIRDLDRVIDLAEGRPG